MRLLCSQNKYRTIKNRNDFVINVGIMLQFFHCWAKERFRDSNIYFFCNYSEPRIETICFCSNNLLLVDNLPMISKLFPTLWITGFHPSLLCFKIDFYWVLNKFSNTRTLKKQLYYSHFYQWSNFSNSLFSWLYAKIELSDFSERRWPLWQ